MTYEPETTTSPRPTPSVSGATGLPSLPAQFTISPADPDVETFASEAEGHAFIVLSNMGNGAYHGVMSIPLSTLVDLLPHDQTGKVHSTILLGSVHQSVPDGSATWNVSLPSGRIAVVEIQPG